MANDSEDMSQVGTRSRVERRSTDLDCFFQRVYRTCPDKFDDSSLDHGGTFVNRDPQDDTANSTKPVFQRIGRLRITESTNLGSPCAIQ